MDKYTVAVAQLCSSASKEANYRKAEAMIAEASQKGASLIVFPEELDCLGEYSPENREAVPGGEGCRRMAQAAKTHGIWVHSGTQKELSSDPRKAYNTAMLFSPAGEPVAKYRKLHLFNITGVPGMGAQEKERILPGGQVVTADTPLGILGLATCYDIRFPELFRLLALRGAQVMCIPACFLPSTGQAHWEVLLRAIAIQNHCYVLAPDQCGTRENGTQNWGHSMIIDPWGTVLAEGGQEQETLLLAQVDLGYCRKLQARLGGLANRREDIYALQELT